MLVCQANTILPAGAASEAAPAARANGTAVAPLASAAPSTLRRVNRSFAIVHHCATWAVSSSSRATIGTAPALSRQPNPSRIDPGETLTGPSEFTVVQRGRASARSQDGV